MENFESTYRAHYSTATLADVRAQRAARLAERATGASRRGAARAIPGPRRLARRRSTGRGQGAPLQLRRLFSGSKPNRLHRRVSRPTGAKRAMIKAYLAALLLAGALGLPAATVGACWHQPGNGANVCRVDIVVGNYSALGVAVVVYPDGATNLVPSFFEY